MPRSSSNSSGRKSYSSPKTPVSIPKPVAPSSYTSNTSYHHHNIEIERPGFFSNMWTGFGLGAGQAIGHNIFRNDPVVKHVNETQPTTNTSNLEKSLPKEFVQCMKDNNNDKDLCKQFLG